VAWVRSLPESVISLAQAASATPLSEHFYKRIAPNGPTRLSQAVSHSLSLPPQAKVVRVCTTRLGASGGIHPLALSLNLGRSGILCGCLSRRNRSLIA
jgi:hypothetical protein